MPFKPSLEALRGSGAMKDLGRAAMAAAALNAGIETETFAADVERKGVLINNEYYQLEDDQMADTLRAIEAGRLHVVEDATPATVDCPADVLNALREQDLKVLPTGVVSSRQGSLGSSINWGVNVLDEDDRLVMGTKSVKAQSAGAAGVMFTLENSDKSLDTHLFRDGLLVSSHHYVPDESIASLREESSYKEAVPEEKTIQERVVSGDWHIDVDKTPVSVEVSDDVFDAIVAQGLHLNKKRTRIEPLVPGRGDTSSWEEEYKDQSNKVVLSVENVTMEADGEAFTVDIGYSNGSKRHIRYLNGNARETYIPAPATR